jgi:hypothetical protein
MQKPVNVRVRHGLCDLLENPQIALDRAPALIPGELLKRRTLHPFGDQVGPVSVSAGLENLYKGGMIEIGKANPILQDTLNNGLG